MPFWLMFSCIVKATSVLALSIVSQNFISMQDERTITTDYCVVDTNTSGGSTSI
jgi:hypothetical protein